MGRDQSAPEYLLLMQVAQTGKSHPGAQRAQPRQEAADRVRPADRHDHDPLRLEIPAAAHRGRFQRDLVADASTSTTATALSTFARARAVARVEAAGPRT